MAKLKPEELRQLGPEELNEKLQGLKKTLMQYRFQLKTGKLERQSSLKETKRNIARVLTILREKMQQEGKK